MALFAYVVKDAQGQEFTGTIEAQNENALRTNLVEQGYEVASIDKKRGGKGRTKTSQFKKVKLIDLAQFCRQFATMINAGVSLVRCLSVLQD